METEVIQNLIKEAIEARKNAYTPYSHFTVGAAILAKSGKIYRGCNIESVSYTPTTCAERVALLKAVSEGEREFEMLAVIGGSEGTEVDKANEMPTDGPCGVCRQFIYEFGKDIKIIVANSTEKYYVKTISELYPNGFGPEALA